MEGGTRITASTPSPSVGSADPAGPKPADAQKILKAAKDFEALLLGQLLKEAQPSDSSDEASAPIFAMAQEQLASVLSARGGLGLATMVAEGLTPKSK
jgi:Rod binding domain-containing protein